MFLALFVRRTFVLLSIFNLLSRVETVSNVGKKKIETILETMRIESRANLTRYGLVQSAMRQHLVNCKDVSPVHLLLHPKANPRVIEAIAKACLERKSTFLWTDENQPKDQSCNRTEMCPRANQIIGIYADINDIDPRALKKSYGNAWNSRSKIVILITQITIDRDDFSDRPRLQEILEHFWSLDCLNVVLMTMPKCGKNCTVVSEPRIFGYDPFALRAGKTDGRGRMIERSALKSFFPDKLRDLRGFSIPISLYQHEPHANLINYTKLGSGIEVSLLRYISYWLNFSVDLKSAPIEATSYKISLPDGQEVGPIGDVITNRSDFLANTVFLGAIAGTRLEFIRPFARANIAILVPRAPPMPGIMRVFRSLDIRLAVAIFSCWILLACYFTARKRRHPFMKTYRLFIHQQLTGISENMSDRIFSISWIIWAFVLCTAFQSQLKKDLTDPPFYKSIDTLEELESSPLILVAEPTFVDSLSNSISATKRLLAKSAIRELDFTKCTERLIEYKDVACALDASFLKAAARKLNQEYGNNNQWHRGIVHIVKESLTDDWRTFVVKEGFPYLGKFNAAYLRLSESGLIQKWVADDLRERFTNITLQDGHFKLNMSHFEGPFNILLIGDGIAFTVFIVEMIFYRIKRRFRLFRN